MNESSTNTDQPFRPTNLLILILLSSLRAANKQTKKVLEVVSKSDEASSLVALLAVAVGAVALMPVTDGLEVGAVVTEEKGTKQRICITSRRKDSSANSWLWRKFRYLRVMKSGVVVVAVAIGAPVFGLGANSSRHHGDELSAEVGKQLFANDVENHSWRHRRDGSGGCYRGSRFWPPAATAKPKREPGIQRRSFLSHSLSSISS
ncbi:unnamed protein product [Peronospora belbahrii]|uniref:Uncharacterized protein n=1 Tax=Peronospora belbahrii TaxID=622444 RepID=A0ABN8DBD4_9STRA|nr:unnamed protein product [Peronospora belbahrii]